jgi:transposase-like protein
MTASCEIRWPSFRPRDKHAARHFLRRLIDVAGTKPLRVTTDHRPAYRKAIRCVVGRKVRHRTNQYTNNLAEQYHRAINQRYNLTPGFGDFELAASFCTAFDELRRYFCVRHRRKITSRLRSSDGSSSSAGAHWSRT